MATKNAREQRQSRRYEKPVCTWLAFPDDNAAYATVTVNVGADGARFNMHRPVYEGEQVYVSIQVGPGDLECVGEICWANPLANGLHDFGVRFVNMDHVGRKDLSHFLDEHRLAMVP